MGKEMRGTGKKWQNEEPVDGYKQYTLLKINQSKVKKNKRRYLILTPGFMCD